MSHKGHPIVYATVLGFVAFGFYAHHVAAQENRYITASMIVGREFKGMAFLPDAQRYEHAISSGDPKLIAAAEERWARVEAEFKTVKQAHKFAPGEEAQVVQQSQPFPDGPTWICLLPYDSAMDCQWATVDRALTWTQRNKL